MVTNSLWNDVWIGLATNIVATLIGIAFAFLIWDGVINRRRFSGWVVRIHYEGREVMPERLISWRKAKEIADDDAHRSVFLKGVASPFARFTCDIITEGVEKKLLLVDPTPKWGFGERRVYTFDLKKGEEKNLLTIDKAVIARVFDDKLPGGASQPAQPPPPASSQTILNFAHPLTPAHLAAIAKTTGRPVAGVRDEPTQSKIDPARPLVEQVTALVNGFGLSPQEWQTAPLLVNLPGYAPTAAALLAELHGRMGHFPSIIRLRPVPAVEPTQYEVAEIVNLRQTRAAARETRAG